MLRSMFAGVSGLRSHQTMMDVVGNNIANVNTVGYKASRVTFQDTLSQLQRGGNSGTSGSGGVNAAQIGLGVKVGGIDTVNTQGALQNTGRATDVAVQGEGYFVVHAGSQELYTRAGAFDFDGAGHLVDPSGYVVQGYLADADGKISATGQVRDVTLPLSQVLPPKTTTKLTVGGNLSVDGATPITSSSIDIYDALGSAHPVTLSYDRTGPGAWTVTARDASAAAGAPPLGTVALTFGADGKRTSTADGPLTNPGGGTFTLDFGAPDAPGSVTQFGGASSIDSIKQDGLASGFLRSFAIANDGTVNGVYSTGDTRALARLALATFANPGGLVREGDDHLRADANSGLAQIGAPGGVGKGSLSAGSLEMSNVDLAQEFTNLIVAQRGFQANSRIITASDELLQDLVNLKR